MSKKLGTGVGVLSYSLGEPSVTRMMALVWQDQQKEHWFASAQGAFMVPLAVWEKSTFGSVVLVSS